MKNTINNLINVHGTPTLFLSKKEIVSAYHRLSAALPYVQLYYALKSNDHEEIIKQLAALGCNFDVCSNKEIDIVTKNNISPDRCIHTHPVKTEETMEYAYNSSIRTFVVDNIDELNKLKEYAGKIRLFFRLAIRNRASSSDLSKKFGCYSPKELTDLIELAATYGFHEFGICFHTGSQGCNPLIFKKALKICIRMIKELNSKNIKITVVDIGGGFPISYSKQKMNINAYCAKFYPCIEQLFNDGIEVIAEPGRFISGNSMFLVTRVLGKAKRRNKMWYYIDDSLFNSFPGLIFDQAKYPFYPLHEKGGKKHSSVIAGYTCDSWDIIDEHVKIRLLDINELLVYKKIGAYASVYASEFNGFPKTKIIVID